MALRKRSSPGLMKFVSASFATFTLRYDHWWPYDIAEYSPSNPQPSHFTQVVWKSSTQVGCAVQSCNGIFDPSFGV